MLRYLDLVPDHLFKAKSAPSVEDFLKQWAVLFDEMGERSLLIGELPDRTNDMPVDSVYACFFDEFL